MGANGADKLDRRDPVIRQLRNLAPASLVAHTEDGKQIPLALTKSGNRWERLQKALDSLRWFHVDALDEGGKLLGRVERPVSPDEETALTSQTPWTGVRELASVMLSVMRSQQTADLQFVEHIVSFQKQQAETTLATSRAQAEIVKSIAEGYAISLKISQAAALKKLASDGGDGVEDSMNEMMKTAMGLWMGKAMGITPPKEDSDE